MKPITREHVIFVHPAYRSTFLQTHFDRWRWGDEALKERVKTSTAIEPGAVYCGFDLRDSEEVEKLLGIDRETDS